ncbi:MAG TPA: hypothetical protein VIF02_02165, partial [Methylocella sp.]
MRRIFACAIASIALLGPASADGPHDSFKIGNWIGGYFTKDADSTFSHCAAWVSYPASGITLYVTINAQGQWNLAFQNDRWQLVPGQAIPVDLTFDGIGPVRVYAIPPNNTLAVVSMPGNSALMKQFMDAQGMQAFAQGNLFGFNLEGTLPLMRALISCVKKQVPSISLKDPEAQSSTSAGHPQRARSS